MRINADGSAGRTARAALAMALALGAVNAAAADDFQETLPAQPEGTLRVELDRGSIEVEAHTRPEVRVDARADGMEFELNRDGDVFELLGRGRGGFLNLFGGGRVRVRVRVPQRFSVDVRTQGGSIDVERLEGAVSAHTQGGSIDVEGAQGSVRLETNGGSIRVEEVRGDVEAHTSGGNIDARNVDGRVEARTSGGNIDLRDVRGPLDAETSGGSVRARFTRGAEGNLRTSGGNVEVVLPRGTGARLNARTSGGRIELEPSIPVQGSQRPSQVEADINGGGARLELQTSGGNIRIRLD